MTYREFIKVAKALEVGPAEIFDAPRQEAELIIHDVFTRLSSDEKADWLGIAQAILGEEEGSRERRE